MVGGKQVAIAMAGAAVRRASRKEDGPRGWASEQRSIGKAKLSRPDLT